MNEATADRLAEDLRVARSLAEAGRAAPLIGGVHYVLWGGAVFFCLLFQWAIMTSTLALSPWAIPVCWFAAMGATGLISGRASQRLASEAGAHTIGNQVAGAVWRAAGSFLFLFAATLFIALFFTPAAIFGDAAAGRSFAAGFSIFLPVCFGAYAIAMRASAAAAQNRTLARFGLLSFAIMVATLALIGRPEQSLVGAAGILIVSVLPGLILIRRARAAHPAE